MIMDKMVVDADGCVAGRMASKVAKELLNGKAVQVVNAEKALVSGDQKYTQHFFLEKVQRGDPYHGPFYPKRPDLMLSRIIRGMLPYKTSRGMSALKRLHVYISIPEELKGSQAVRFEVKRPVKCITLGELAAHVGGWKA